MVGRRNVEKNKREENSDMIRRIGFIGVGNMGSRMAINVLKSPIINREFVMVYDVNMEACCNLVQHGAFVAHSIQELASQCNVIVLVLPSGQEVVNVLTNEGGVFTCAQKSTVIIDSSTIDPLISKQLHTDAGKVHLHMLDAPISGGITGAAEGTLTFMTGGTKDTFEQNKDFLKSMGSNIFYCGEGGSGSIAKICNNLAAGILMAATCEALALGKRLGIDPVKLSAIMNASTGRSWSTEIYSPIPGVNPLAPSSHNYNGGFKCQLMEKDLALAFSAANSVKARIPLGSMTHQLYGLLCEHGHSEKDFSYLYQYLTASNNSSSSLSNYL